MATMDVQAALNMPGMINDPNIERKGILSAISASDDHWQALISHPNPREMVLTSKEKDDTLFRSFTYEFSTMESMDWIICFTEDRLKGTFMKAKWRSYLSVIGSWLGVDHNRISLLRCDCRKGYTNANTVVVPRSQFLCIEICRNRLGFNNNIRENAVVDDLRCRLDNFVDNVHLPRARSIISRLSRDFGALTPSLARSSGWWLFLTKIVKSASFRDDEPLLVLNALQTLRKWTAAAAMHTLASCGGKAAPLAREFVRLAGGHLASAQQKDTPAQSNDPKIPVPKSKNAVYRDELSTLIGLAACLGGTRLPKSEKNTPKPKSEKNTPKPKSEKNTPKPAQERVGEFVMAPTSAGVSTAKGDLEHKFMSWMVDGNGALLERLVFPAPFFGGERGVAAACDIAEEHALMSIPTSTSTFVTADRVRKSADLLGIFPFLDELARQNTTKRMEQEDVVLALFLANEKLKLDGAESSDWAPWIHLLPSSYPTVPLRWTDDQLARCQDPALYREVKKQQRAHNAAFNRLKQSARAWAAAEGSPASAARLSAGLSMASFTWAFLSVQTRTICFPRNVSEEELEALREGGMAKSAADFHTSQLQLALVPFLDMLNHKGGPSPINFGFEPVDHLTQERLEESSEEEEEEGDEWGWADDKPVDNTNAEEAAVAENGKQVMWFSMKADRSIKAGEQIMFSYGQRTNRDLLFTYGFLVPEPAEYTWAAAANYDDAVVLDIGEPHASALAKKFPDSELAQEVALAGNLPLALKYFMDSGAHYSWLSATGSGAMQFLRMCVCAEEEAAEQEIASFRSPGSLETEVRALKLARDALQKLLFLHRDQTPTFASTSVADDSNQLKALAVATPASIEDQRLQLALVYRLAHKRILARHLRRVLFALDMLRAPTVPRSKGEWLAALTRAAGSLDNQGWRHESADAKRSSEFRQDLAHALHYVVSIPMQKEWRMQVDNE